MPADEDKQQEQPPTCGQPHTDLCVAIAKSEATMTEQIKALDGKVTKLGGKVDDIVEDVGTVKLDIAEIKGELKILAAEKADQTRSAKATRRGFVASLIIGLVILGAGLMMWLLYALAIDKEPVKFLGMPDFAWAIIAGAAITILGYPFMQKLSCKLLGKVEKGEGGQQ